MAKRLEIIGNFIKSTDTITGIVEHRLPTSQANYRIYSSTLHIVYINRYAEDFTIPLANIVDSNDTAFASQAKLEYFLDHNLGAIGSSDDFVANETNTIATFLLNVTSEDQTVDGSIIPVEFSYTPPAGFNFICARIIFYMEGASTFDSNLFGNQTALTNGWTIEMNGVETMSTKTNRDLGTYMFDVKGDEIYGKTNRTIIARFSFDKFTNGAGGITIRDGQSFKTIVKDDLTGLTYLEAKVMGVLKPV